MVLGEGCFDWVLFLIGAGRVRLVLYRIRGNEVELLQALTVRGVLL